ANVARVVDDVRDLPREDGGRNRRRVRVAGGVADIGDGGGGVAPADGDDVEVAGALSGAKGHADRALRRLRHGVGALHEGDRDGGVGDGGGDGEEIAAGLQRDAGGGPGGPGVGGGGIAAGALIAGPGDLRDPDVIACGAPEREWAGIRRVGRPHGGRGDAHRRRGGVGGRV